MKKSMLLGILFLSVILLVSCGESPQEKLVGEWQLPGVPMNITFNSDGTMFFPDGDTGKWELSGDKEPFQLKMTEGDDFDFKGDLQIGTVTFISDDEMEIDSEGEKITIKRNK